MLPLIAMIINITITITTLSNSLSIRPITKITIHHLIHILARTTAAAAVDREVHLTSTSQCHPHHPQA